jgi:nitrite reductase (NADH) small subunit
MPETRIGRITQIPRGEGRTFAVDGMHVAVFHTRTGEVFAVQAECPHRAGPLADGLLGDATVLCPLHERAFDLRTGKGVGNDDRLTAYPVRVEKDGTIIIAVA